MIESSLVDVEPCFSGSGDIYKKNFKQRSILNDLIGYNISQDIKNQADVIYNKMKYQVRRGKIRLQMLFYCVYCAHLELQRDVNPLQLAQIFGLSQGEIQRCSSLFSPLQTGYKPPCNNISPINYLSEYSKIINLSQDALEDFIKSSSQILEKDPSLNQENPQTVAAGLLKYYTFTNGISNDDSQLLTKITNRSIVTIDNMFKRISMIDNC